MSFSQTANGHRKRLRDRFLQGGLESFLDYEIVELLLTLGTPRKDCKQMAKQAIKEFGSLRSVLDASLEELQQIQGIGPYNAFGIKLFQAISERHSKDKISRKTFLTSPQLVADYLRRKLGRKKKEYFLLLWLDASHNLIKAREISIGILDASLVHPREVFKEAIKASAAQVILAHNHPSGNLDKSPEDLRVTQQLSAAGNLLGIDVIDHIIVTNDGYVSFQEQNWM